MAWLCPQKRAAAEAMKMVEKQAERSVGDLLSRKQPAASYIT